MPRTSSKRPAPGAPVGTQSIDRAVALLRLIANHGAGGARLTDLAAGTGLVPPTARRILKRMAEHRLVAQDPSTQRYSLGALTYELGLATTFRPQIVASLRPVMERIAKSLGDTVYLMVRSGAEAVCIDRVEGSFPIKALTLDVGGRRPLGIGPAGLALLASLPDTDIAHALDAHRHAYVKLHNLPADRLLADVARVRKQGYAVRQDAITAGVAGIGMAVPNGGATPFAAISIAMISARFNEQRLAECIELMRTLLAPFAADRAK